MESKVLIVDDDEVVLGFLGAQLEAEGFTVVTCTGVQKAVDELIVAIRDASPFDLVISDLDMPDHRGTVLIRIVRDLEEDEGVPEERRLPILLLSGLDPPTIPVHEQDELMGLSVSFLSKDDAGERLIETVRCMLHG